MAASATKTCTNPECTCDNPQPRSEFQKDKNRSDGLKCRCKTCKKALNKKRYADPEMRERIKQQVREYNQTEEGIKKRRIRHKARGKTDWQRLKLKLANRLRNFVIVGHDSPQNQATMGCTRAEIRAHIEAQFEDWMNWDNYGLWQFDHIVPYAAFPTVEELEDYTKVVCWYKNVRPLHETQNRSDGGDYDEKDKQALIAKYISHQLIISMVDSAVDICEGVASSAAASAGASSVTDLFA